MTRHPTTRLHISGYRFLLRRLERALLGEDIDAAPDGVASGPAQALTAGAVVAVVLMAGCAVLAVLRPQPTATDAAIMMEKRSGALYIRAGDVVHPVLNLASARLIAKSNVDPQPIDAAQLSHSRRGPLLGIPGAPQFLGTPLADNESQWTVCDSPDRTTVVVGRSEGAQSQALRHGQALLVKPARGGSTYLLFDGRRAVVDMRDPAVTRALGIEDTVPKPVSSTLLNVVPEVPRIAVPRIPGVSGHAPGVLPGFTIGSVLRVASTRGDQYYVVLHDGVQRVGRLAADLVRFTNSQNLRTAIAVAPDLVNSVPAVTALPVSGFPDDMHTSAAVDGNILCVRWAHSSGIGADVSISVGGLPIPAGQESVTLTQADGTGPAVDAVYVAPGRVAYVRATSLSGDNAGAGTRYLVSDSGIRFAVHDDDAAHDLGLPDTTISAPWSVLAMLPAGEELSRANASVAQDVLPGRRGPP